MIVSLFNVVLLGMKNSHEKSQGPPAKTRHDVRRKSEAQQCGTQHRSLDWKEQSRIAFSLRTTPTKMQGYLANLQFSFEYSFNGFFAKYS